MIKSASEGSGGNEEHCRETLYSLREYLNLHKLLAEIRIFKSTVGEDSKEEHVIGNWGGDGVLVT